MHQIQRTLFADIFIQRTAKAVRDVVFAIRKSTCAAEAAHHGAPFAVNASLDLFSVNAAFEDIVGTENITDTGSADAAVKAASRFASPGDVVLLSPCCASFDLFSCYEDRGEQFKAAVRNL